MAEKKRTQNLHLTLHKCVRKRPHNNANARFDRSERLSHNLCTNAQTVCSSLAGHRIRCIASHTHTQTIHFNYSQSYTLYLRIDRLFIAASVPARYVCSTRLSAATGSAKIAALECAYYTSAAIYTSHIHEPHTHTVNNNIHARTLRTAPRCLDMLSVILCYCGVAVVDRWSRCVHYIPHYCEACTTAMTAMTMRGWRSWCKTYKG